MKNYDDLQRFKEKTQTLDIDFKDMSHQAQNADHNHWAILRQLSTDDVPELGQGQRIDLPQPQPVSSDAFAASSEPYPLPGQQASVAPVTPVTSASSSLFPPPMGKSVPPPVPKAVVVERQHNSSLFPPPAPESAKPEAAPVAAEAAVPAAPAMANSASPGAPAATARFGSLFRTRSAEAAVLSKETLLKPLLEKIALCR